MTKVEELKKMYENMGGDPEAVADKTLITEMLDAMSELELSELPDVTADDNGDVLTVVDGAWAKAAAGSNVAKFSINMVSGAGGTTVTLKSGTLQDVENAVTAGKTVILEYSPAANSAVLYYYTQLAGNVRQFTNMAAGATAITFKTITYRYDTGLSGNTFADFYQHSVTDPTT